MTDKGKIICPFERVQKLVNKILNAWSMTKTRAIHENRSIDIPLAF